MILLTLVIWLPLLLLASNGNFLQLLKKGMITMPEQRGYRKAQYLVDEHNGTNWVQEDKTIYYYKANDARPDSIKIFLRLPRAVGGLHGLQYPIQFSRKTHSKHLLYAGRVNWPHANDENAGYV